MGSLPLVRGRHLGHLAGLGRSPRPRQILLQVRQTSLDRSVVRRPGRVALPFLLLIPSEWALLYVGQKKLHKEDQIFGGAPRLDQPFAVGLVLQVWVALLCDIDPPDELVVAEEVACTPDAARNVDLQPIVVRISVRVNPHFVPVQVDAVVLKSILVILRKHIPAVDAP